MMRAAIPTELLLRLMNATPEQYAAVERALGMNPGTTPHPAHSHSQCAAPHPASGHLLPRAEKELSPVAAERVTEDVARSAFALLQKLDMDAPLKAPSALTVFRLYCVDGLSADRVARKCGCGKATVMRRLRFIEARTRVKAEQFRSMSAHLQQIDDELNASGAREIYRRGLVSEGED